MDSTSQMKNTQKIKKQKEIFKKLETELNKKEKEKSIVTYFFLAVILGVFLLGMGAFSFSFTLYKLSIFKNHLSLIIYASLLRHYTNLGIYHSRILSICNMEGTEEPKKYINNGIAQNRTKYIQDLHEKLLEDFNLCSNYLEQMIEIDANLKEHNKEELYSNSLNNVLFGNSFIKFVSSSYMVTITKIYSHFYYMVAYIDNLDFNSTEVINFVFNALNFGGILLRK